MAFRGMTATEIVDDTISKIVAASTVAGSRVYRARTRAVEMSEMPLVAVGIERWSDAWADWSGGPACSVAAIRTSIITIELVLEQLVSESDDGNDADNDVAAAMAAFQTAVVEAVWGSAAWRKGTDRTTVDADLRAFHDVGDVASEVVIGQDAGRRTAGCRVTLPCDHLVEFGT